MPLNGRAKRNGLLQCSILEYRGAGIYYEDFRCKKTKTDYSSDDTEMKKGHPEYQKDLTVEKGLISMLLPAYSARFYQVEK